MSEGADNAKKEQTIVAKSSKGSKKGERRGGREKGTPNKRTQELIDLINAKYPNFDPILSLIDISLDNNTPLDIKVNCLKEVAKYIHPQRKAVEVSASNQADASTQIIFLQHLRDLGKNAD